MNKFYIGDKIKIISNINNRDYGDYENKIFTINRTTMFDFNRYGFSFKEEAGASWVFEEDMELVSKNYIYRTYYIIKDIKNKISEFYNDHDEGFGIAIILILLSVLTILLIVGCNLSIEEKKRLDKLPEKQFCEKYSNDSLDGIPAKCIKYFYNK